LPSAASNAHHVPRRFGVGSLLVVTAFFAVLLGGMSALGAHPVVLAVMMGFFLIVGLAQAILFRGKDPRAASVVAGGALFGLVPLVGVCIGVIMNGVSLDELLMLPVLLLLLGFNAILGGVAGYLAGVLLAGVFLVMERLDAWIHGPVGAVPDLPHSADNPWSDENRDPPT